MCRNRQLDGFVGFYQKSDISVWLVFLRVILIFREYLEEAMLAFISGVSKV